MRFLRRPRPGVNEILSSYLLRVTGANGYSNYRVVAEYVGIQSDLHKLNYLSKGDVSLELLSRATGVIESRLWEMVFPVIDDRSVRAYGATLEYQWLEREKVKICPHCLAETGYYHQHWALWLYTSCHIHQCLLVNTCPQCQSEWRWDDLKNDWQCECSFNFREAPIADLGSGQDNLSGLVFRSCRVAGDNAGSIERTSLLDAFDLSQLSLLMMSTALCLNNPGGSLHQLKLPSTNRELDALLSRCAIVYGSEQPNLEYFLQWFGRMYRSKYQKAGKRRNHLERLSLISTFRQKLDDLHLCL
jgi:TniQ